MWGQKSKPNDNVDRECSLDQIPQNQILIWFMTTFWGFTNEKFVLLLFTFVEHHEKHLKQDSSLVTFNNLFTDIIYPKPFQNDS